MLDTGGNTMGNVYGYVRVSSIDQNEDRQLIVMDETDKQWQISTTTLCFEGECECEFYIRNNLVQYNVTTQEANVSAYTSEGCLDDYYNKELKPNIVATVFAILLSDPNVGIGSAVVSTYLDNTLYQKERYIEGSIELFLGSRIRSLFEGQY